MKAAMRPPLDRPCDGEVVQRKVSRRFSAQLEDFCFAESFASGLDDLGGESSGDEFAQHYEALRKPGERTTAKAWQQESALLEDGKSSFTTSWINLTKSLIGIGMLALPRALADGTAGISLGMMCVSGSLCAFSFFMLGYCAHLTGAATLPQLWDATIGSSSAVLVELVIVTDTSLSCIAFALLIGDYASLCMNGLLPWAPALLRSRGVLIFLVGICVLLPLSLIRQLSLLRYSSLLGIVCTMYVFLYVVSDSSRIALGKGVVEDGVEVGIPPFEFRPGGLLRGVAIVSCAFMAHFQAPAFYADLKNRSPTRFLLLVSLSFACAGLIYASFGLAGLYRFGDEVPGNALAGYSLTKPVILMFLGMTVCVTCSFPLCFRGLFESSQRLAGRALNRRLVTDVASGNLWTATLVLGVCFVATLIEDLSAAVGMCGSLSGACLTLIFPGIAMMHLKKKKSRSFIAIAWALVALGVVQGLSSATAVVVRDLLGY